MSIAAVAEQMLETYPRDFNVERELLVDCTEACHDCEQACTQCADDCLSEQGQLSDLAKCIRLNLDCADICAATGRVVSRQTEYDANVTRSILEACIAACAACGDECAHHGEHMDHCRICSEQCRSCVGACQRLSDAIS